MWGMGLKKSLVGVVVDDRGFCSKKVKPMRAWTKLVWAGVLLCQPLTLATAQGEVSLKTVAEVYYQGQQLLGKRVRIKAEVIKVYKRVLGGHNYLRITDAGQAAALDRKEISVVTDQEAKVGERVTVDAVVARERDFGFQDRYFLILKDGVLIR